MSLPTRSQLLLTLTRDTHQDQASNTASNTLTECPICYDIVTNTFTTPCNHTFCHGCLSTWLRTSTTCPNCRSVLCEQPARRQIERFPRAAAKEQRAASDSGGGRG
ncbi:hypothetical protein CLAFUW4_14493 [Fulvia fulva]|uniref:RING-type domain-containing protein n=1 Tax=Passalora fulva TaxID=5499 RepID=A0A9Q8UWS6_PASFU|nr:uncharacterized protein CLAFUR5_14324 [Fulvia fulva]KAK4609280.1 hypothetical protein CLAFUR4_14488 [Fulvia fulva]KAK4609747.1 hypothetical protein CLAFUR0_14490 [Fulvia fulva]UJO25331.1 hypothetical protein CLAFUR5_14324 [Fulvia fulva]WPV22766.1 hypothetical protein CLAFUW4_14493 [Fulvia fulva]WPV37446.1 hypothetical protein CLAFUW7_14497 [Fulvia fulva]